ncbi:uncharacterized protein [Lolium perenne]|uniref:uncharacterized protein n=1 Tax=Lolium perenne TaxID=4522 RepID=UPI003A99503F
MSRKLSIDCWNVRGLGMRQKRDDVRAAIELATPSILLLQETKLTDVSSFLASSFLPATLRSFVFKPSVGASGGILTAWDDGQLQLLQHSVSDFSITTTFSSRADDLTFSIVNVYGPCHHDLKKDFLDSLNHDFAQLSGPAGILGDFNLIRTPREKSSGNFNAVESSLFNEFINDLALIEIPLLDRQFTWSNQQDPPIMARLDRALVNQDWSFALPDSTLTSSARPSSDHVPLHLIASSRAPRSKVFRMENSWLSHPSFTASANANRCSVGAGHSHLSPISGLCLRLKRIRAAARVWAKDRKLPPVYLLNCRAVISLFDRWRSIDTFRLEKRLRSLAKTSLDQRSLAKQPHGGKGRKSKSCVLGDENTRYFHLCASGRLRKNQIKNLEDQDGNVVFAHQAKSAILHGFFKNLLGTPVGASDHLDLASLVSSTCLSPSQASALVRPFSLDEIRTALFTMNDNSSPGPDGFGPAFFKKNWDLVKKSLLDSLSSFHTLSSDLRPINKSHIVLLPKKEGANKHDNFRPISLQAAASKSTPNALP